METKEWTFIDRSKWTQADLTSGEPDKVQWLHKETGLPCLVHRGPSGAWCGYVGVSKDHSLYEKHYNNVPDFQVHGGLTFSDICSPYPNNPEHGICHVVDNDEKVWWFGFDCAHSWDISPAYDDLFSANYDRTYRTIGYARRETENLAKQIAAYKENQ